MVKNREILSLDVQAATLFIIVVVHMNKQDEIALVTCLPCFVGGSQPAPSRDLAPKAMKLVL